MPANTNIKKKTRIEKAKRLKKQQENQAFNNVLLVFTAAIILEILLIIGYRQLLMNHTYDTWFLYMLHYGRLVLPMLTLAAIVLSVAAKLKKWPVSRFVKAAVVCFICTVVFFLAYTGVENNIKNLCTLVPVVSLLLFVFFIYQFEFFLECLVCTLAIFSMMSIKSFYKLTSESYVLSFVTIGVSALTALLSFIASRNRGRLTFFKKSLPLFDGKNAVYITVYIASAISVLACVFGLIFGRDISGAATGIIAAFVFIAAVFHTVKLM